MVSTLLLTIGFGVLLLAVGFMKDAAALRRSGSSGSTEGLWGEALILIIPGLIVVLFSFYPQLPSPGPGVLRGTGVSLIGLGFSSLIQLTILAGRATVDNLRTGAWITAIIGLILIVVCYPILLLVFYL